jgi:thioredoxin 1
MTVDWSQGRGSVGATTTETFEAQVLAADRPVLVDFWAGWCAPCKQVAPVVAQLAADFPERLAVVAVDVEGNPVLAQRYRILSVPQLLLFNRGEVVRTIVGARPRSFILRELDEFVG